MLLLARLITLALFLNVFQGCTYLPQPNLPALSWQGLWGEQGQEEAKPAFSFKPEISAGPFHICFSKGEKE